MDLENYVTDLSTEALIQSGENTPNPQFNQASDELGQTKIMNINDFIFRQNLEFYPNLTGIKCRNNELIFEENGEIVRSEVLTFDLRTLPGHVWNYDAKKFMEVIKFNKDCLSLGDVANYINDESHSPVSRERVI